MTTIAEQMAGAPATTQTGAPPERQEGLTPMQVMQGMKPEDAYASDRLPGEEPLHPPVPGATPYPAGAVGGPLTVSKEDAERVIIAQRVLAQQALMGQRPPGEVASAPDPETVRRAQEAVAAGTGIPQIGVRPIAPGYLPPASPPAPGAPPAHADGSPLSPQEYAEWYTAEQARLAEVEAARQAEAAAAAAREEAARAASTAPVLAPGPMGLAVAGTLLEVFRSHGIGPAVAQNLDPQDGLIKYINGAKFEFAFAIFSLASQPITDALIAAAKRGVKVYGVADNRQWAGAHSTNQQLVDAGIDVVRATRQAACMHLKVGIIDRSVVALGSYNWTNNAENANDEILLVSQSPELAAVALDQIVEVRTVNTQARPAPKGKPAPAAPKTPSGAKVTDKRATTTSPDPEPPADAG